ncbi:MAG: hypothetical protein A3B23_03720 [Candidatus Colwellbacteria bacterium RIFCSPLOWO2_01_FULL_48_10]|uniref:Uncharacterized protein n=1 Tax=Candidatus Colwellbacteria bacterium RIFCSPLOWO2_01_FULL_48_10 TaxID=1797690 RepID=A0A1G1Z636_9BACT|nr:MAG: hypothetical protein A3B23_03720 [Candidatus Colwellbacteria bacterium RIFCSPLOWO2_01_FULL_48_10]
MIAKELKLPIGEFPKNHRVVFRGDFFSLRAAPNGTGRNRLGVNFRSKAFKTAVLRNRLRRTVFDFFRTQSDFLKTAPKSATDLLITLNPAILTLTKQALINELKSNGHI